MIQQVLAQVAKNIKENAPYLSRVGGYAWPQSIRIQDRVKVLPACEGENGPQWMIPETAESAVVFFESNEAVLEYQSISTMLFRANVRLIVWLNTSRLSGSTAQVEQDIINALHEEPTETFPASRIVCRIVSRLSGPGIFTRYTFDEPENQQLMPPFQYFAYNINVNFVISPACATSTVIQTAPQC